MVMPIPSDGNPMILSDAPSPTARLRQRELHAARGGQNGRDGGAPSCERFSTTLRARTNATSWVDIATRLVVDGFFVILGVPPADRDRLTHPQDVISRLTDAEFQLAPVAIATPEKLVQMAHDTVTYANREMARHLPTGRGPKRIGRKDDFVDLFAFGSIEGLRLTKNI